MQTLVAYVENKPGVLNRVSSLARRLAINIDSLTVGPTENEEIARMTIVAHTDEKGAHRLEASLEKLVDVRLAEMRHLGCIATRFGIFGVEKSAKKSRNEFAGPLRGDRSSVGGKTT